MTNQCSRQRPLRFWDLFRHHGAEEAGHRMERDLQAAGVDNIWFQTIIVECVALPKTKSESFLKKDSYSFVHVFVFPPLSACYVPLSIAGI